MTKSTDTFIFDRSFPLPPDRMWTLMTAPEYRELWGAPDDGQVLEMVSTDFTVGGTERHRCGPAEAPEFEVATRWYNIDAPSTVTFTEQIEAGGMVLGTSLVTYMLEPEGTGTQAGITVAVVSFVGPEMIAEFRAGWDGGIAKLDALAAKEAA
ncbi:MAG: SRPBCC domain-containing protein [Pseudomonadota bacterium]